jgi:hypothetical protein
MVSETRSKWIEAQIARILGAYSKQEVDRVIPVLLILMARDFGFQNLEPRMQKTVAKVEQDLGLPRGAPHEAIDARIEAYIATLKINVRIIDDIRSIFATSPEPLPPRTPSPAPRKARIERLPVMVGGERSADGMIAEAFTRRATGLIRG